MNARYGKFEKLKGQKKIDGLFAQGNSFYQFPIRIIYQITPSPLIDFPLSKTGVSVSKRNFKKATDRNKIKRLLREAYRKNKYLVNQDLENTYTAMLLYVGKEMPTYALIDKTMNLALKKFRKKLISP